MMKSLLFILINIMYMIIRRYIVTDMVFMIPGTGMITIGMIVISVLIGDIAPIHTGIVVVIHMLYFTIRIIMAVGHIMTITMAASLNRDHSTERVLQ